MMTTPASPRETFDRRLRQLQDDVLFLESLVEHAVQDAVQALKRRDLDAARRIYAGDLRINEKRYEIENNCLILIATQQPMARDLRTLAAILEISTELERMGDYAKGICRINMMLGEGPFAAPLDDLQTMADLGLNMLRRALSAFIERDVQTARAIPLEDDQVDALYNRFHHELIKRMIADPSIIDHADYLVWAAHNLERLADRVTNICERIVFVATGEMRELDAPDNSKIL